MKKRAIPQAMVGDRFQTAVKENLEIMMGQRGDKIVLLPSTATTAEIVAKINELIEVLQ